MCGRVLEETVHGMDPTSREGQPSQVPGLIRNICLFNLNSIKLKYSLTGGGGYLHHFSLLTSLLDKG